MKIIGNNITMIRGDSETLQIELVDNNENPVDFKKEDKIYFSVKESVRRDEYAFQKVVDTFQENQAIIEIEPEDTHNLRAKDNYVYDIQLISEGKITTIVGPSDFALIGDVTREQS